VEASARSSITVISSIRRASTCVRDASKRRSSRSRHDRHHQRAPRILRACHRSRSTRFADPQVDPRGRSLTFSTTLAPEQLAKPGCPNAWKLLRRFTRRGLGRLRAKLRRSTVGSALVGAASVGRNLMRPLAGLDILVVEDRADSLRFLPSILEQLGATVMQTEDASHAFELLKKHRPRIVVSDVGCANEMGLSLIRRIRKLGLTEGRATPAIALTATSSSDDRKRLVAAGFQSYLTKPIDVNLLVQAIVASTRHCG
jgi:CheY-like chemotaxis protein